MKHVMTFESFSVEYDKNMVEEGFISDTIDRASTKISDYFSEWDKQENINCAKTKGKSYVSTGKIDKDLYDKAVAANFDTKNKDVKEYLMACAKIRNSLYSKGKAHTFAGGAGN